MGIMIASSEIFENEFIYFQGIPSLKTFFFCSWASIACANFQRGRVSIFTDELRGIKLTQNISIVWSEMENL